MADIDDIERSASQRRFAGPHSGKHPIPTIQGYREHRKELQGQIQDEEEAQQGPEDESKAKQAYHQAKAVFTEEDAGPQNRHEPYPSENRNLSVKPGQSQDNASLRTPEGDEAKTSASEQPGENKHGNKKDDSQDKSATETAAGATNAKDKRKAMKKTKRHGAGREVTDPVTHLPVTIHDQTEKDLDSVPENDPEPGMRHRTMTGTQCSSKSQEELSSEKQESQHGYNGMHRLFPPPDFDEARRELGAIYQKAVYIGAGILSFVFVVSTLVPSFFGARSLIPSLAVLTPLAAVSVIGMGRWARNKTNELFEDEIWDAAIREEQAMVQQDEQTPESVQWLNSLFSSIWPLVNPDLFASLVDQIEDVMQASLPKVIKMVSVDDMGQGSESMRILGIRWLPTGAASQDASESSEDVSKEAKQDNETTENEQASHQGLEAEEGDFVNLEMAVAYRSRKSGKSIRSKVKNAHLYLKFYLPGGIAVPVWVELRGLIMTVRLRLQLTPDPPFVQLCTLTFLGQPKASLSCVPLSKHSLNLMNVPFISSFVQSAIDAALAEYVAPKSLTLDLKSMLMGEDFKKNTNSKGVVWIYIKSARGFKQGDGGLGPFKDGSSDAYVTVSWGKFGKPVSATRIIGASEEPCWREHAAILVTPEEINAEEKLRLQLWDSDKWTADDDLGRVEVDLKSLMKNSESHNKIQDREDRFTGQDPEEEMPGSLTWAVGYFDKTGITDKQLQQQDVNRDIRTKEELKEHVSKTAEHKLREADKPADDDEVKQQKAQDYAELESTMICAARPCTEKPSGILSIQIHNITGLEIQKLQKEDKGEGGDHEDESERSDDMPDSYCTVIVNHKKVYRTRTKPQNSKPFFNAATERFITNWQDTEVIVSVRDSRERENDPLIGLVYLPLSKVFAERSQVAENYPLVGGIGYGRARISLIWRATELEIPAPLQGWRYGTLEVIGNVKPKGSLPHNLTEDRIKVVTNMGKVKMVASEGEWKPKSKSKENPFLPVRKRQASAMVVEFRESALGPDKTVAFAVLWLNELTDEEQVTKTLTVWKGSKEGLRCAKTSCDYHGNEEGEKPLGEIEMTVKFWRGLSGYHKSYASHSKNQDMRHVMECLDTITDEKLDDDDDSDDDSYEDGNSRRKSTSNDPQAGMDRETRRKKLRVHTNDTSSSDDYDNDDSSDSDDSDISIPNVKQRVTEVLRNPVEGTTAAVAAALAPGHNDPDDGSRGMRGQARDYKDHHKQLHRKHRGIMQWRMTRQLDHIGGKASRLKGSVTGLFKHDQKEPGIETEV
ncbi:C2 domain-containing protein [Microdochium nivale]|nr:C2 domain-containing protein [Microdochium nivale]